MHRAKLPLKASRDESDCNHILCHDSLLRDNQSSEYQTRQACSNNRLSLISRQAHPANTEEGETTSCEELPANKRYEKSP